MDVILERFIINVANAEDHALRNRSTPAIREHVSLTRRMLAA